jgi:arsenical pump membrane protein
VVRVPALPDVLADVVGVASLGGLLVTAHRHPPPRTEATAAVLAAGLTLATGLLGGHAAWSALRPLLPVVGFLVAILVVAEVCARAGLFEAAAQLVRRHSAGSPQRLLLGVFVLAAIVTTVLSLDATVVLLTPVVVAAARGQGTSPRPGAYACLRLANSGSLLLPVSNLTNLLAMPHLGLSFGGFAARMALPLVVVLIVEYAGLRLLFRADLHPATPSRAPDLPHAGHAGGPFVRSGAGGVAVPTTVVALMLVGFAVLGPLGIEPWVPAAAAAAVLVGWGHRRGLMTVRRAARAAHPAFALWVLALGLVVAGLSRAFLGDAVAHLLPHGHAYPDLLLVAAIATLASAVLANLSATLLLLPLLAPLGTTAVLAGLLGVTIGAGITWTGSLANLLWRRTLVAGGLHPSTGRFHRVSLLLTPVALVAATAALRVG